MKKYIYTLLLLGTFSCVEDFLDRRMDTNYTEEQAFASYTTIRNFGIGIYSHLPDGFDRFNGGTLAAATDDAAHSGMDNTIQKLGNGNWGASAIQMTSGITYMMGFERPTCSWRIQQIIAGSLSKIRSPSKESRPTKPNPMISNG